MQARPPRLRFVHPLRWVALAFVVACSGPRGATPLPEPPALTAGKITGREPVGFVTSSNPIPIQVFIVGEAGAATPAASIRVTNLETMAPVVATTAASDGSFELTGLATSGDVLRVEAENAGIRGVPLDYVVVRGWMLASSPRFDCVTPSPGLSLGFGEATTAALTLENDCASALSVTASRTRLGLPDFGVTSTLPLSAPAGSSTDVVFSFTPGAKDEREDVVFLNLSDGTQSLRYPVTLYVHPEP